MDQCLKALSISLNFFTDFLSSSVASAVSIKYAPRGIGTSASQPSPSHFMLVLLLSHLIVFLTVWPHSTQVTDINASSVGCLLMADKYKLQSTQCISRLSSGIRLQWSAGGCILRLLAKEVPNGPKIISRIQYVWLRYLSVLLSLHFEGFIQGMPGPFSYCRRVSQWMTSSRFTISSSG